MLAKEATGAPLIGWPAAMRFVLSTAETEWPSRAAQEQARPDVVTAVFRRWKNLCGEISPNLAAAGSCLEKRTRNRKWARRYNQ